MTNKIILQLKSVQTEQISTNTKYLNENANTSAKGKAELLIYFFVLKGMIGKYV